MVKQRAEALLSAQVVDITPGFPAADAADYLALADALLRAKVFRIPIVGIRTVEGILSLALFSAGIQEHAQLVKIAGLDPQQLAYASSLEGYPFADFDYRWAYLKLDVVPQPVYQRLGQGSDRYPVSLNHLGIAELTRIFAAIGSLENL